MQAEKYRFVVVGGGIAGVTCTETLSSSWPEEEILLITASPLIKTITNYKKITKTLEDFDVVERPVLSLKTECPNVKVIMDMVTSLDSVTHILSLKSGKQIQYKKLCICTGGKPKLIAKDSPYILGIRDTESVKEFQQRLSSARRVVVVGNGGIATELVYEIEGCEIIWAIKDKSIASTFVDAGAAEFFLPHLNKPKTELEEVPSKRLKYTVSEEVEMTGEKTTEKRDGPLGGALGPDWSTELRMSGPQEVSHSVHVEKNVEVSRIIHSHEFESSHLMQHHPPSSSCHVIDNWPVYIELTNQKLYGCDFVVSATGVTPYTTPFISPVNKFEIADDYGFKVNDKMQTSVDDVYAAGDVCSASWEPAPHWLQMRLWSQARQMGAYAAQCMVADTKQQHISLDFCFELFAHVTKFFNFKVILLGKFNAQGLGNDYEILLRVTKGEEYVKAILHDGRLQGAILIGETDLEETFENLILNQIDLTPFKDELLNPNIDIDDFFD